MAENNKYDSYHMKNIEEMDYIDIPNKEQLFALAQTTISTAWNLNTIHKRGIERWLENFTGAAFYEEGLSPIKARDIEHRIALYLLCNFVYYTEEEVRYLMKIMLDKYLHFNFLHLRKKFVNDDDIYNLIKRTRFSVLGNQSESSAYMLYLFRQVNELSKKDFDDKKECDYIAFVDDFSITGNQAEWYIKNYFKEHDSDRGKKAYVLLMVATEEAIEKIKKIPEINIVLSCITMNDSSKIFSTSSIAFQKYSLATKQKAEMMCRYYGEKILSEEAKRDGATGLGYGDGGFLIGTYYNTPNNTLPIFWSEENGWKPIFKRYDKKYIQQIKTRSGNYV